MRELSLFSGAGGGLLGTKLLGWTTIGYVEYDKYCQKILKQRATDGILDTAPIFGDIKRFISEGYAECYKGMVDVISAGFPCQPFSVAGKGKAEADERNMWPSTRDCIGIIRPRYCLLENVPGLLTHKYIQRIFGDLAEMGYNCKWGIIGADDIGAPHRRKRLWIVAHSQSRENHGRERGNVEKTSEKGGRINTSPEFSGENVAHTQSMRIQGNRPEGEQIPEIQIGKGLSGRNSGRITWWDTDPADIPDTERLRRRELRNAQADRHEEETIGSCKGTGTEGTIKPQLGRVAHGVAHRVDRLKAIGNGQVPAVVRAAWEILN